jgi:hypothetical protein
MPGQIRPIARFQCPYTSLRVASLSIMFCMTPKRTLRPQADACPTVG